MEDPNDKLKKKLKQLEQDIAYLKNRTPAETEKWHEDNRGLVKELQKQAANVEDYFNQQIGVLAHKFAELNKEMQSLLFVGSHMMKSISWYAHNDYKTSYDPEIWPLEKTLWKLKRGDVSDDD